MNGLRDQLLAGATLPADEHREIGLRHLLDGLEDLPHRGSRAHQVLEAVVALDPLEQHAVLAHEPRSLERAGDDHTELLGVEGLGHVVLRAKLHRLDRDLLRAVGRDHDHGRLGTMLLGRLQHVHAARTPAKGKVGENQIEGRLLEHAQGLRA